jgi:hypothetical protein
MFKLPSIGRLAQPGPPPAQTSSKEEDFVIPK